jgi:hypothetical protein
MSNLIVPDEFKEENPFQLPFRADADMVLDANNRGVAKISEQAGPQEALRIAKLFASSTESLSFLHDIAQFIEAATKDDPTYNHGAEDEDKENCVICSINAYIDNVLS